MISQKIRNNASISYFFLGWLFLLAKKNPNFSDPFIRLHAKTATKGHLIFFVAYFFYAHFLSKFFSYSIPVIQITIDHCIDIAFFAFLTLFIVRGAYNGQKSESLDSDERDIKLFTGSGRVFQFSGASEAQRIILLLSHIPFISLVIAKRYPNIVTIAGARISSLFGLIYITSFVYGGFDSLSMILMFIGIFIFVFLAAQFFLKDSYTIPLFIENIPGIESMYAKSRSIPPYITDIGQIIFGKKDSLSFVSHLERIQQKDISFRSSLQAGFTDKTLPFKSFWIFVPFANLVFIPKLFITRNTQYVLAIGQGIIITFIAIGIGLYDGFTSPIELFLLFPIMYGMSSLESDVFIRIPLVYEIYVLFNTLSFGLLKNTKQLQTIQKQDNNVSFKID